MPAQRRKSLREDAEVDFYDVFDSDTSSNESDVSEYGRKGKKRVTKKAPRKSTMRKRGRTPTPHAMSDIEYDDRDSRSGSPEPGDSIEVERGPQKLTSAPNVVQIHLNEGAANGTVINLDLSEILKGMADSRSDSLALPAAPPSKRVRLLMGTNATAGKVSQLLRGVIRAGVCQWPCSRSC